MTRPVALLLTAFTGFSGLTYEVAWQKYLATLLGSHSEATAAVLGIFLGGLSVGYWLFGILTRRLIARAARTGSAPRLLTSYGVIEAAIGVYVMLFPALFSVAQAISVRVPIQSTGTGFAFDVLLAACLIGPASVLMGATIPILTQALARSMEDATRFHAFVYAFNTVGAFAGAIAAGFYLIPQLGLVNVMFAMGLVNLTAGGIFIFLGLRGGDGAALGDDSSEEPAGREILAYTAAALLAGFAMMTLQTTVMRLGGLAFGSSQFTFSMVVAVFVLCIAIGSFGVSALPTIRRSYLPVSQWLLVAVLYFLYDPLQDSAYWAHRLRLLFDQEAASFYPYYLSVFGAILAVLGPAVALSGALLPLLFHEMRREMGGLGASAGRLYSWNTVGSLLGALLGGYALLFWLDLHHLYRIAVGALAVAAALVSIRMFSRSLALLVFVPPLIALLLLDPWRPALLASGLFRVREAKPFSYLGASAWRGEVGDRSVVFYDDDPTASIMVRSGRDEEGLRAALISNGKPDGSTRGDLVTMALSGVIPALFAGEPRRSFVIGYGTGVTCGELLVLDSVDEVVVAEISPGVLDAAPFFDFANHDASRHPKLEFQRSDAYRALLRSEGSYDLIISEPSNPWVTGVEMLYSVEFLRAARSRLAPSGVYAQWLHQYEIDTATLELVLRTYVSTFEHVAVWYTQGADLLLLGFNDAATGRDLEGLRARALQPDFAAGLRRAGIENPAELFAHELLPVGVLHAIGLEGPLHTLAHPRLNFLAGRAFFSGRRARLPFGGHGEAARVGAEASLLGRHIASLSGDAVTKARLDAAAETCRYRNERCAPLLASWANEEAMTPAWSALAEASTQKMRVRFGLPLEPSVVQTLRRFYDANGATEVSSPGEARLYRDHYHHAVPFAPGT